MDVVGAYERVSLEQWYSIRQVTEIRLPYVIYVMGTRNALSIARQKPSPTQLSRKLRNGLEGNL